jgi:hypothetical protein
MKFRPQFLLALAFALFASADARAQEMACGRFQTNANHGGLTAAASSISGVPEATGASNPRKVTRFATRSEGDHSLEAMTVDEQLFARYSLYTVRLQFASGAEQSLAVTAPPGGLRPEMSDMSGDNVPNDVVLTSGLLRIPLVVLLNEGHDHLTVAISPGSFSSGEDQASGPKKIHHASALLRSGFRSPGRTNDGELFSLQLQGNSLFRIAQVLTKDASHTPASGRAPPAPAHI